MRLLKSFAPYLQLTLLTLFLGLTANAQNILYGPYTFDDAMLDDWTRFSDLIAFTPDGTANAVDGFWNSRPRIQSTSLGGAAVFFEEDTNAARFRSPLNAGLNFSGQADVFLSFHQYYRTFNGSTELNVYEDGVLLTTVPIRLNETVGGNVETSAADTVIVDLSAVINQRNNIQIEFVARGYNYFWILDDVTFYDANPYPATVPETMGNYLADQGYPYEVEGGNNILGTGATAYVPEQLVVQFAAGVGPGERASIRDTLGAVLLQDCVCGTLELWEIDGSNFFDPDGLDPAGGSIDILTNKDGSAEKPKIDNVDLNYYNGVLLNPVPPMTIDPIEDDSIAALDPAVAEAYKIAIIDTGMDYLHPELKDFIRIKPDSECYSNDPIGWNFVDDHNNPFDDNGHGTHVAGILADTLKGYNTNCDYEIIPYKTHDRNGISTLFQVSCATYQSIKDDVDFINDSWGFFGDPSPILRAAMDSAAADNILIVTAAGNDSLWLDTLLQYPACYNYFTLLDSVVTVGATDSTTIDPEGTVYPAPAVFSNYSNTHVDILAPGANIRSTVPRWYGVPRLELSGTSMATPMVTAATAIAYCCNRQDASADNDLVWAARDTVLNSWADKIPNLNDRVVQGRFLVYSPDESCLVDVDDIPEILNKDNGFFAYPNPVEDQLWLNSKENRAPATMYLINAQGQYLRQWQTNQWYQNTKVGVDLSGIPAGVYYIRLMGDDYQWAGKIIKL